MQDQQQLKFKHGCNVIGFFILESYHWSQGFCICLVFMKLLQIQVQGYYIIKILALLMLK